VIPLAVYYVVRSHLSSDAVALAIAGIPAAVWVLVEWVRKRVLDPIGAIILFGFLVGLLASWALGGSAFVLKARDSAFTAAFGVACLASLATRRPVMFYLGRSMSAGDNPSRRARYDELIELPPARAVFVTVTAVWGVALLLDAGVRLVLAWSLPTGPFLALTPVVSALLLGGAFAFTMWFSRWARGRGEVIGQIHEVPQSGGSVWWWLRRYGSRMPDVANDPAGTE
jgi:hypothetical protein